MMRRPHRQRDSYRRLLIAVILLGLLMVPVECAMVHGPHSIFVPPGALAAPAAPEPVADRDHHHHGDALPPPGGDLEPPQLVGNHATAGRMLAATVGWLSFSGTPLAEAAVEPTPRLVAPVDTTAAPGVPAVLLGDAAPLGPSASEPHLWPTAAVPPGRSQPGPEPPPP